ncbi:hypothetical protein [Sodaliphilus sp.]|uniref:hypothetical protein n=1 Tax=Sodaliphilus sp. TaxID=2815818 RepID=UPI00388F415D
MKKFLLLSAAAVAMTASAAGLTAGEKNFTLGTTKHSLNVKSTTVTSSNLSLNEAADLAGEYVGAAVTEDPVNSCGAVVIEANPTAANSYTVKGAVFGLDATVTATYANGQLTIPAGQQVYNHSTYGPACLFAMDDQDLYDLVLTVGEDGSLTLDPSLEVAMLLVSGNYAGYALGDTYSNYSFQPVNGTCTFDALNPSGTPKDPATETYNTSVKLVKDADGNVTGGAVYGFDDMTWLPFTADAQGNVQFSNDKVYYYSSSYALAFATDLDDEGHFYTNVGPTGVIDAEEGTLVMPHWTFILPTTGASPTYYILNSVKSNCVVTFPVDTPTAINDINVEKTSKAVKMIENGQVVIVKDGVKFNVAGQTIK